MVISHCFSPARLLRKACDTNRNPRSFGGCQLAASTNLHPALKSICRNGLYKWKNIKSNENQPTKPVSQSSRFKRETEGVQCVHVWVCGYVFSRERDVYARIGISAERSLLYLSESVDTFFNSDTSWVNRGWNPRFVATRPNSAILFKPAGSRSTQKSETQRQIARLELSKGRVVFIRAYDSTTATMLFPSHKSLTRKRRWDGTPYCRHRTKKKLVRRAPKKNSKIGLERRRFAAYILKRKQEEVEIFLHPPWKLRVFRNPGNGRNQPQFSLYNLNWSSF